MTYPRPQELIVGVDPAKCRVFAPDEVAALLRAFQAHTGADPLADGVKLDEVARPTGCAGRAVSGGKRPTGDVL